MLAIDGHQFSIRHTIWGLAGVEAVLVRHCDLISGTQAMRGMVKFRLQSPSVLQRKDASDLSQKKNFLARQRKVRAGIEAAVERLLRVDRELRSEKEGTSSRKTWPPSK